MEDATATVGPYKFPPIDESGRADDARVQPGWYGLGMNKSRTGHVAFIGFVNGGFIVNPSHRPAGALEHTRTTGTCLVGLRRNSVSNSSVGTVSRA